MILYSIEGSMTLWALRKEISRNEKMKKAEKREKVSCDLVLIKRGNKVITRFDLQQ
jgi:hypothetical protein